MRRFEGIVKRIPSNVDEPIAVTKIHHVAEFFRQTQKFVSGLNSGSRKRRRRDECH